MADSPDQPTVSRTLEIFYDGSLPPLWDSLLLQMNGVTLYLNDLYGSAEDLLRFWKVADRSSCAGISAEVKND